MITSEFPPFTGGVGQYVYNLSTKLVERQHEVTVITRKRTAIVKRPNLDKGFASKGGVFASDLCPKEFINGVCVQRVNYYPFFPLHAAILTLSINKLLQSIEQQI